MLELYSTVEENIEKEDHPYENETGLTPRAPNHPVYCARIGVVVPDGLCFTERKISLFFNP